MTLNSDSLRTLEEQARLIKMSPSDEEAQRRSFAYGNANIENTDVTKSVIDLAAQELALTGVASVGEPPAKQ